MPSLARSSVSQASNLEPGTDSNSSATRLAGFEEVPAKNKVQRRQTETIDLPPSFYRHLNVTDQRRGAEQSDGETNIEKSDTASNDASRLNENGEEQDNASENESGQQVMPHNTKWARYPFRTLGEGHSTTEGKSRNQPLPAGWMKPLPRTPRYGYPNGVDLSTDHE